MRRLPIATGRWSKSHTGCSSRACSIPRSSAEQLPAGWTLVTELTAINRVAHKTEPEFFGLVVQSAADNSVLIAIRGTDTFLEWLIDAEFTPRAFQGAPGAGMVEDGFASVYDNTDLIRTGDNVLSLVKQLPAGTKVTIAGHSLGAAVATLVAVDIGANVPGVDLTLYTYARRASATRPSSSSSTRTSR